MSRLRFLAYHLLAVLPFPVQNDKLRFIALVNSLHLLLKRLGLGRLRAQGGHLFFQGAANGPHPLERRRDLAPALEAEESERS